MAKKNSKKSGLGRKPLEAGKKKVEVRFFIEQSVIDLNGGIGDSKKYAIEHLNLRASEQSPNKPF